MRISTTKIVRKLRQDKIDKNHYENKISLYVKVVYFEFLRYGTI